MNEFYYICVNKFIMSRIIVIGSSNMDLVARMERMPAPGETVGGASFMQANGGKGANQAVAASRLGGDVLFVSCVGDDLFGESLRKSFSEDGLDISRVKVSGTSPTGTALIFVDSSAQNSIAVAPGSNSDLLPEDIDSLEDVIAGAQYLLVQLEIPLPTVERAVNIAYRHGVKVLLNPAPFCQLPEDLLKKLFLITPNEVEAGLLAGKTVASKDDAQVVSSFLRSKGVENVIVTLGSNGSLVSTPERSETIPACRVKAVDTTAAGDVFNGALVVALSEGRDLFEAALFATKASAISVTRAGAQPSIPFRGEVSTR